MLIKTLIGFVLLILMTHQTTGSLKDWLKKVAKQYKPGSQKSKDLVKGVVEGYHGYLNNNYKCQQQACKAIGPSPIRTMIGRAAFAEESDTVQDVFAWARGPTIRPFRFKVRVMAVDRKGFEYTVTRVDSTSRLFKGWLAPIGLYWTTKDRERLEKTTTIGEDWAGETFQVPPMVWFARPAILESSSNVFTVLGREVHLSGVQKLLHDASNGEFPVTQTTSSEVPFELTIRGDIVYLDDDVTFQGLKKMEIYARKLLSNGKVLNLTAPTVCDEIDGSSCIYHERASDGSDGVNGKPGIGSPTVDIYLYELQGNVKVFTQASQGTKGQDGGDGNRGDDNHGRSPDLTREEACKDMPPLSQLGRSNPGPPGGHGGDGKEAGSSGNGGDALKVTLEVMNATGKFTSDQFSGKGGEPAENGYWGEGGSGGSGGCTVECFSLPYDYGQSKPPDPCAYRPQGPSGATGQDGFAVNPVPHWGNDGIVEDSSLNKVESVKTWFKDDISLLSIIQRRGESLFLRNKMSEALEDFVFINSVTDEDSEINQRVSVLINAIEQGFDYYGNTKQYAPDLDWFNLHDRVTTSLKSGQSFEDTYNKVTDKIEDFSQVQDIVRSVVTDSNDKAKQRLQYQQKDLTSRKGLYIKAIKTLETRMDITMEDTKYQVQKTIAAKKSKSALESFFENPMNFLDLISSVGGYVTSLADGNALLALTNAEKAIKLFDKDDKPKCKIPTIKQATDTMNKRLVFGYKYKDVGPENLDFSKMDVSAVPVIMRSDLGKNKLQLSQEFSCLIGDGSGALKNLIDNFFMDAGLRITQIDQLINIDIKLKSILHQLDIIQQSQHSLDVNFDRESDATALSTKMQFTDLLFNLYQQQEAEIMSALYELSKAYQFVSLWNFDIMGKYVNNFGDRVMTKNLGSLDGMFQLQSILGSLESERYSFLDYVSSDSGPASHTFNAVWKFHKDADPIVFKSLEDNGQFTLKLEVDPNDETIAGCANCYNGRLISMYIELSGKSQQSYVPSIVYVRVVHLGDSSFLSPGTDGAGKTIVSLQQTPEDVAGGNVMTFDMEKPVTSKIDPALKQIFANDGNKFCEDVAKPSDFFGGRSCKSPYATYTVVVPKGDHACSLDPDSWVDGSNCKGLDLIQFDTVRVYTRIKSWSNYAPENKVISMKTAGKFK